MPRRPYITRRYPILSGETEVAEHEEQLQDTALTAEVPGAPTILHFKGRSMSGRVSIVMAHVGHISQLVSRCELILDGS